MSESDFESAEAAEAAFYAAFEAADADAMMQVWADDSLGVECIHPMSTRLRLRETIEVSWREIFSNGAQMQFKRNAISRQQSSDLCVHVIHEDIRFGPSANQRSRIIATNVYRRTERGWLMVLHHGSPGIVEQTAAPAAESLH